MKDKLLKTHSFILNEKENGGESLMLSSTFIDVGNNEIVLRQQLSLQSYCNSASFELCTALFTPEKLRQLANELDAIQAKLNTKNK